MKNIESDIKALLIKVESLIENDWQLQASVFGFVVLAVLVILIKIEWSKHEPHLTNLHRRHADIRQFHAVSNERLMKLDSFNKYDYERIQQYPDEDPLTFVKKQT